MIFRTSQNIFKDFGEYFDPNWMDKDTVTYPPSPKWVGPKEIQFEDVDIWEVIVESGRGKVYASWCPHAEFFMLLIPFKNGWGTESIEYYWSEKELIKRLDELQVPYKINQVWVDE
jgi:hypothetical protein